MCSSAGHFAIAPRESAESGGISLGGSSSSFLLVLILSTVITLDLIPHIHAGHCWSMMNKQGKCSGQLAERISKEDCCNGGDATTAWTAEDLESGRLFFWMALGGGVPNCLPCKDSCQNVLCPDGKKCVVRKGQPKCVCAPDCSKRKKKGPVCGSDGKTYRHYCQLLKKSCRQKKQLHVAYFGHCQKSCKFLTCPGKKQCLLDQNHNPHCVKCIRQCPETNNNYVCGVDNVTYNSLCHLRQAACEKGYAIPMSYFGKCKASASCENVRCGKRRKCLTNTADGLPRCSSCSQYKCRTSRVKLDGPICGTDNLTYPTWCHMMQQSCRTGLVIETKHNGACEESSASGQEEINCIPLSDGQSQATTKSLLLT